MAQPETPPNQHIIRDVDTLRVRLWDLGPRRPAMPTPAEAPTGNEGTVEHDLAMLEFEQNAERQYQDALQAYRRAKKEWDDFERRQGGPVEIEMWSVNAREAMERDPERYVLELPPGLRPGHGHADNQRRAAAVRTDLRGNTVAA